MIREYYEAICNGVDVRANLIALRNALKDEKEIREYKATELKFKPRRRKKEQKLSKEEMAELKALEGKRGDSKLDDN